MVEIITRGMKKDQTEHTVTCNECDTLFKFTQGEAEYVFDYRDGDALKIKCPYCKHDVWKAI